ncbi:YebG family protein [Pantoea agglomerans]|uniref:YebG family protein n=1 Tax=Enterobacter agglomerans TaxID=549 RepID=UPI002032C544|nr:YebG family protein [Pantoea agglomerans]URW92998.1 YebG family protein [Pantoea agglomerans]
MAVETKFVVVRKGEEKMTFANKKEADAYDKMLDMAEAFTDWLLQHQPAMEESQAETLGLLIAEQKDAVQHILRTSKLPEAAAAPVSQPEAVSDDGADEQQEEPAVKKVRAVKAA